jgi:hypothetical protein
MLPWRAGALNFRFWLESPISSKMVGSPFLRSSIDFEWDSIVSLNFKDPLNAINVRLVVSVAAVTWSIPTRIYV